MRRRKRARQASELAQSSRAVLPRGTAVGRYPGARVHVLAWADEDVVNHPFGPRTNRVYAALREQILGGELQPGSKLPPHLELAAQFGVAPMTVRQVLGRLEAEGLVQRRLGSGTFVREPVRPAVLIVGGDPSARVLLCEQVERAGCRAMLAVGPEKALAILEGTDGIALVLIEIRLPGVAAGVELIRAVWRW